jgi:hypothetical protein
VYPANDHKEVAVWCRKHDDVCDSAGAWWSWIVLRIVQ